MATTENNPYAGLSQRVCDSAAALTWDDLPEAVRARLKLFLIDTLGVIRGATEAPGIAQVAARLSRWERDGTAGILLTGRKVSPPSAALANGAAAHALDFDDQHDPARVHTNCVVVPALLATAQDIAAGGGKSGDKVSGKDFLLALAIGAELHARLGLACNNSLGWGWHPTMVQGTLAASIACGRLLGLDAAGIRNALGMGYHQASGSAQSMRDGVLSKRIGAGFASRAAVLGAFFAADGLSGTQQSLEGSAGLIALYERNTFDLGQLLDGLWQDWAILDYSLKPYPCCRATHSVIGLGLQARRQGVRPDDLAAVKIGIGEYNWIAVGAPYDPARKEVVHAQFNACYAFARALQDGKVDFTSFTPGARAAADAAALTARSTCIADPRISPEAIQPAYVELTYRNGTREELYTDVMKGSPADPMSDADVIAKYRACVAEGLPGSSADAGDALLAAIAQLEHADDAAAALYDHFPRGRA